MSLDPKTFLGPLFSFFRSFPILSLCLLVIPFAAPSVTEKIAGLLIPFVRTVEGEAHPQSTSLHQQLAATRQENKRLKTLLKDFKSLRQDMPLEKVTLGQNLGQSSHLLHRGLILEYDTNSQVLIGSPVTHSNCLIGFVHKMRKNLCYVRLIWDPQVQVAVDIIPHENPESTQDWPRGLCGGSFENQGYHNLEVFYIPKNDHPNVKVGDYVVTSGTDFKAPAGLLIGRVSNVKEDDLFLNIHVVAESVFEQPLLIIQDPPLNPFSQADQEP